MWIKNIKNKKAFTLIEFIIVMAIIGILVLLASPKFLDYVDKAKLTQIINDSKVAENYITTHKAMYDTLPKGKNINEDELSELVKNKTLYFKGDIIKGLNDFNKDELYLLDKDNLTKEINTKLKGDFIYTDKGIVYIDSINYKNKDQNKEDIDIEDLENMIGPVKQVSLGNAHSAAITEEGDLYTWGYGNNGRLGHGDTENQSRPKKVDCFSNKNIKIRQVALGNYHSAVITEGGDLYTWGLNNDGQLGHGNKDDQLIPKKVKGIFNVDQVSLGRSHSAAIVENGDLYTWGQGGFYRLGHGNQEDKNIPTKVKGISNVKQVSLAIYYSAAITEDGSLYTWGEGENGSLGHGNTINQIEPKKVEGIDKVKQVALGQSHSAAITENGDLYTWGSGSDGRLGHGNTINQLKPKKVEGIDKVKQVALGQDHSAAITEDGGLYTWGEGKAGKLGHGNTDNQLTPKKVEELFYIKQVNLGFFHSAAITENGDLYTWGSGTNAKLGHDDTKHRDSPTKVEHFNKVRKY